MEKIALKDDTLLMRPLETRDAGDIHALASAKEIADNTFVPHPYPPEAALDFIRSRHELWRQGEEYVFGIIERGSGRFAGCMGIRLVVAHHRAEVGYWIGKPYWGRGLATSALCLLLQFGFERLHLNRIEAGHFEHNPASGRVMQKAGMQFEGIRRQYAWHGDHFIDLLWYVILREDYETSSAQKRKETAED